MRRSGIYKKLLVAADFVTSTSCTYELGDFLDLASKSGPLSASLGITRRFLIVASDCAASAAGRFSVFAE